MKIHELIEKSRRLREAAQMMQENIARLQTKLPVAKSSVITDAQYTDFIYRVLGDEQLTEALNKLADGGVKIVVDDRVPHNTSLGVDGTLFIHNNIPLESIRSFLELTPAKASA